MSASLFALSGEAVYKTNCASCHAMQGMMSPAEKSAMREKMQHATPEEKQAMKQKMMAKMKKSDMKAPPMPMVSKRLKGMTKDRQAFIVFVKDYIQNPSQDKGFCMPMAYKRFGTMPPIGKGLSEEERQAVAVWLHDNFKGKWGDSAEGKACEMRNNGMKKGKGMKCGGGKCGQGKKSMKCGAGKCGKQ